LIQRIGTVDEAEALSFSFLCTTNTASPAGTRNGLPASPL
jgi:hypothetical protein